MQHQLQIHRVLIGELMAQPLQLDGKTRRPSGSLSDQGGHGVTDVHHDSEIEFLLGTEIMINQRLPHIGGFRDGPGGDAGVTLGHE